MTLDQGSVVVGITGIEVCIKPDFLLHMCLSQYPLKFCSFDGPDLAVSSNVSP